MPHLDQIEVPVGLIHGTTDAVVPCRASQWISTQLPPFQTDDFSG